MSKKRVRSHLLLAATIVSLSVTIPMDAAYADNPTPTRGANAAYTITNGTDDNYNFTTSDGSTTSYYKTNLSVFNLLNNINDSTVWLEGTQDNNNFSVVLPNNETRYFIYGYTKPDGWGDGDRQVYDYNGNAAGNSAFYNNRTFNGLNSTVSGGAINIQAKYPATAGHGSNFIGTMTADFTNNSITNTDTSDKGLGGALHIWGPYAGIETLNSNFINNHITYGTAKSGGGALAIGEGYNGGESTVGLINGNFINNYIDAPSYNFGGAIYYEGSSYGDGEITSIGQDPVHTTKFVGNHILGTGQGGAIYAVNKIGSIYADFIGNYIAGLSDTSKGGAISLTKTSDEKTVGSITGDFIGNYITTAANNGTAWGGAIYNNNSVGSITGDFIGNYVVSEQGDTYGGAIYNTGTITTLTSNFIDNYANGKNVYGGAIYNTGTITTLNGKFIENDAYANVPYGFNAVGGAIANKDNGVIQNISGDFIRNKAHSYTSSSSMYARGGAIYNEGAKIGTINANFIENEAQRQAGAIYNNGNSSNNNGIGTVSGNFIKNKVTGEIARELYGGAIFNEGTIGNITANFTSNSTQAQSDNNQYYNAFGGAIANNGSNSSLGDITGVFDGNSSVHNFAKVDTGNYYGAFGGAIYNNGGKIGTYEMDEYDELVYTGGIKSSTFQNNKAESNQAAQGGAIWTNRELNLIDTSFVNNSAISSAGKSYGGAIYAKDYNSSFENLGVIRIKAKTANVTFSGNKAENGAAIYSESNGGTFISAEGGNILFENNNKTGAANGTGTGIYTASTLFLNTENEHTITINDNIDTSGGYGWGYLDVTPAGGNIYLNGSITTGSSAGIRMGYSEAGALVLGQTPANQTFNSLTAQNDSTLSLQNNHAGDNLVVNTFTGSDWGSLKFNIDYDATANSMDKITVNSGSGTITLNAINVLNDNEDFVDGTEATYLDGTARNNVTVISDAITSTVAGTTVYTFTPDSTTHGLLTVSRGEVPYEGDLINAIQDDVGTSHPTAYSMQDNYTADRNFGALNTDNRTSFTIFGNNHTVSGANTYTGIEVANGQILNLDSVRFSNVKTYDVQNEGTLNLSGTNTINKITDAATPVGVTNITGGTTTIAANGSVTQDAINLQGGNLNVNAGSTINSDIFVDGTLNTTGRLSVINSTINGTIHGTFKGNTDGVNSTLFFMSNTLADNDLTLNSVNFESNSAIFNGGLFYQCSGDLTLNNNQFTNNTSNQYGAMFTQTSGITSVTGATFKGNASIATSGNVYGGAISKFGSGTLTISDTIFGGTEEGQGNSSTSTGGSAYGGAIYQDGGTLSIADSKFINNSTYANGHAHGGAIFLKDGSTNYSISGTKTGTGTTATSTTEFTGNQTRYNGGAIYVENTSGTIDGVVFKNNSTETNAMSMGGVVTYGATTSAQNSIIQNSSFILNSSPYVVSNTSYDNSLLIKNSEFINNTASQVIRQDNGGSLTIKDTVIKNNANSTGILVWEDLQVLPITAEIISETSDVEISGNRYGIVTYGKTTDTALTLYAKGGDILINGNTTSGIENTGLALTLNADTNHNITINDAVSSTSGMTVNAGGTHAGTVALNGALTFGGGTNVQGGTLKLGTGAATSNLKDIVFTNNPALDLQNSTAQTLTAVSINGNANLNIDIDFTGDSVIADAINISTGGQTGTLTINSIAALASDSDIKTFENLAILTGETTGVTLALSEAMQSDPRFNGDAVETITWESDYSDTATFAQSVFTNTEYSETKQKQLSVVDNTKLSYAETTTVPKHATGNTITQDVLQALNQSTSAERSLTTDSATAVYTVGADLGTTGAGTLTVQGVSGSELSMSGKTGFELTNAGTVLNLKDLNITGLADENTSLLGIANLEGTKANLENITVSQTITKDVINNLGELNFAGTNTINSYIGGTGTTNINGGKTTLAQLVQNAVNITAGELEVANITTANGISNADTLTLTGTSNANAITGTGHTVIAGNVYNTGSIGQAITVNSSKTLTTNANLIGGAVTNSGTVELTSGTLGQTITGGNITISTGEVTAALDKLDGTITNNSTLITSGTLNKAIGGTTGVTKLNDNMTFADGASIAGTLNFNGKAITMSGDNATTTFNVGKINSNGTINIDINTSGATPVYDEINLTAAGSTGTITINSINEIGARGDDFTLDVLQGTTGSLQLSLSDAVHSQFDQAQQHNIYYVSDAYQANIDFDKTSFDTAEWDRVTQKAISVENNTQVKYTTNVISDTPTGTVTQKDALAFINQNTDTSAVADRSLVTADTNKTYTVTENLGTTGAGTLLVQGANDKSTTLDMNNKTGFVVANSGTEVTLKNINVNNTQNTDGALVNVTNSGSSAVLDVATVNVKDNPTNKANVISSNGTVTVKDSTVNAGINNTGTLDFEGTSQADKVAGATGTTNVKGQTTLGSLVQKLVNIVSGGKLIANGDVTTGTGTGEGINNAVANGLELNGGTLTGNVTGAGSVKTTGNSSIADGSTVSQAVTVASGKLTTSANGLGGAVTNGSEVDLTGGTLETSITGGNTTISGTNVSVDDTNGSIASAVSVSTGTKLTTNASNVTGTINNGGNLDLTGGDIQNAISGEGTTTVSGAVTNTTDSNIGNAVTVASTGDLTTAANKLGGAVTNAGTVKLNGGTLSQTITGGNISIIDDVDTNASNLAGATSVASEKELTLTGGELTSNVTGAGSTKVTGSVNNKANISTATEVKGGALDNTNGQLANVTVTSGSLKSNADNVGAVNNAGTYEITGGTIVNAISGTGNVNITGNTTNNTANTITGAVTVAENIELAVGTSGDAFTTASSVTMNDGSTLNLQNGATSNVVMDNLVVAAGDTVNLKMDWNDTINSASANIDGNLSVTDINMANTTGDDEYTMTTTLDDKISISENVNLSGVTSSTSNFVNFNKETGEIVSYKNSLVKAVDKTDSGMSATYVMNGDETAGGGELDGTLKVQGNGNSITTGGIVIGSTTIQNADLTLEDVNLKNISGDAVQIYGGNKGHMKAVANDLSITGNSGNAIKLIANGTKYAEMDFDAGSNTITIDNDIVSDNKNNKVNFKGGNIQFNGAFDPAMGVVSGATLTRSGADSGIDWTITSGTLLYTNDSFLNSSTAPNSITFNGGNLDTRNGAATTFALSGLTLTPGTTSNFYADVDLAAGTMDNFGSTPVTGTGSLNVAGLSLISDAATDNTTINFTTDTTLMAAVNYTGGQGLTALSPVYKYNVAYDNTNGNFDFARYSTGGYGDYNPAVLAAPVAAQMGGYLSQLNSYDEAFRNMDMYMLMTKDQRQAMKMRNKYAADSQTLAYDSSKEPVERTGGWFRPYANWETVNLKHGPHVENTLYGSYFGLESGVQELSNGWDGNWGVYAGYNGSHQHYDGVSIYQNGGTLGLNGMLYKGDFFTGLTANIGANAGDASTMYGNDDFAMLMTGVASKTGYNWELADGKFIIQPNYLMSYTMVNTFDYTNAAGVRINSDPLHAIQIEPGLKFIGNLPNGWQPYAGVSVVWNVMDKTHFDANDASLPNMSVKPFVKYGVGVRKTWGERFTGFLQAFITNGGRNGVGLQAGFRWALGKNPSTSTTKKAGSMPEKKETKITLNNIK